MARYIKIIKQRNYPKGKFVHNIKTGKRIKVIGIGKLSAIEKTKTGKLRFVSARNLRLKTGAKRKAPRTQTFGTIYRTPKLKKKIVAP